MNFDFPSMDAHPAHASTSRKGTTGTVNDESANAPVATTVLDAATHYLSNCSSEAISTAISAPLRLLQIQNVKPLESIVLTDGQIPQKKEAATENDDDIELEEEDEIAFIASQAKAANACN